MAKRIAYFISPHGFGHAARAAAVMSAVYEMVPSIHFEVFTTVPSWFFEESLRGPYTYHRLVTDIGLVQETPLHADLAKTVKRLSRFIPFNESRISGLAKEMDRLNCELVVCDIAPMGIAVAREAGLPSVLVENFTWDWVYAEYIEHHDGLKRYADYLGTLFEDADYHVQTQPVCSMKSTGLTVLPVSRRARCAKNEVRQRLGIPYGAKMVLITMGGIPEAYGFLEGLALPEDVYFVIPGGSSVFKNNGHLITLLHHSKFFHPDLINAADAVVGKVGYSTLAEVYHGGVPFGYIKRPDFRESEILAAYIRRHMNGFAIDEKEFRSGGWISDVSRLLKMPRIRRKGPNGATQVAKFVCGHLDRNQYTIRRPPPEPLNL
ncbi:MAG: hypothetical protein ISR62_02095 [Desulfobacteraceae bacterium]|nr:hypothetical protein [Desulfobacterales bacterium]MBL6967199.1 hypothetical protein [Desulfobacteraceae bacterium]MBL7172646.1 hypothetical protein [Desulfobacteraceae bacterium]MBU0733411.1 hypothetical protein [Pseudomonadota bacterium]MBU0988678.1 hypothetical protein [Pseudomonadota bacterium]